MKPSKPSKPSKAKRVSPLNKDSLSKVPKNKLKAAAKIAAFKTVLKTQEAIKKYDQGTKMHSQECKGCGRIWYNCLCSHDDDDGCGYIGTDGNAHE